MTRRKADLLQGTLDGLLRLHPAGLPVEQVVRLAIDVCNGLDAIHRRGIVHRDVKPSNILLFGLENEQVIAKVCDFGIARDMAIGPSAGDESVHTSGAVGSVSYMSPEQWDEEQPTSQRSDLYSLGIVLYELLVGRVPFRGELRQVMWDHTHVDPEPPSDIRPDIPEGLEQIILRALEKRPEARHASATEMRQALEALLDTTSPVEASATRQGKGNVHAYCRSLGRAQ